ncbi:hypothetical protein IAR50_004900 [Cryptococcus sp. DSM 104548]
MPHSHSHSTFSSPFPKPTRLPRSPSDPIHLSHPSHSPRRGPSPSPGQQIYVLTADGSSLFLVDPSKPSGGEEPPPYASFPVQPLPLAEGEEAGDGDRQGAGARREFPSIDEPHRHRARTFSAISNQERHRPRTSTFTQPPSSRRARSALSTPEPSTAWLVADESTPLLLSRDVEAAPVPGAGDDEGWRGRGWWKGVWCGELEEGEEDVRVGWGEAWRRYWRPVGRSVYWGSVLHLVVLNFPFALMVWPWLLIGTLVGTALLITLPLGAMVWWLTLFIARSAARLETIMQLHYHTPLPPGKTAQYHPIFYRPLPRSTSPSYTPLPSPSTHPSYSPRPTDPSLSASEVMWDKRFTKNSYTMFLDHYSYSALSYFLLIKPLVTLFGTIMCILVLALGVGTVGVGLPVGLRVVRRWGRWQGEVALDNL